MSEILRAPEEITGAWLGAALGRDSLEINATEGDRQRPDEPEPSRDVHSGRRRAGERRRQARLDGSQQPCNRRRHGAYWREVSFSRGLAPRIGDAVPRVAAPR